MCGVDHRRVCVYEDAIRDPLSIRLSCMDISSDHFSVDDEFKMSIERIRYSTVDVHRATWNRTDAWLNPRVSELGAKDVPTKSALAMPTVPNCSEVASGS